MTIQIDKEYDYTSEAGYRFQGYQGGGYLITDPNGKQVFIYPEGYMERILEGSPVPPIAYCIFMQRRPAHQLFLGPRIRRFFKHNYFYRED